MRTAMVGLMLLATPLAAQRVTPVKPVAKGPTIAPTPVTEDYFGTNVTDRFRGLDAHDAPTLDWMRAQGGVTRTILGTTRDAEEADIAACIFWRADVRAWQPTK